MANRSDASHATMRRMDRRLLCMGVANGWIQPENVAQIKKLMIEASKHARNVKNKRSTMLTNVDSANAEDESVTV